MNIETKELSGKILEVKQEDRNGVRVGILEGYIATWDIDETNDRFLKGAFLESILEHIQRRRPINLKDHHGRTVGGFPMEFVKEDEVGLYGIGEVNLEVQQGFELHSLAKQGVISDFSIGFSAVDFEFNGGIREISKAIVWEGSAVDEPANRRANIVQVKSDKGDEGKEMTFYNTEDVKEWTKRDIEKALRGGAQFSKSASKSIMSQLKDNNDGSPGDDEVDARDAENQQLREAEQKLLGDIMSELKGVKELVAP